MSNHSDKIQKPIKNQSLSKHQVSDESVNQNEYLQQNIAQEIASSSASAPIDPNSLSPHNIVQLQRIMGNQALVRSLKQSKADTVQSAPQTLVQRGWLDDAASAVGGAASAVGNAVGDAASAVGNAVGDAASAVGNAVSGAVNAVGDAASAVGNAVGDALDIRENEAALDLWEDYQDSMNDLNEFIAAPHVAENFQSTTRLGYFDAAYNAAQNQLNITCRCKFNFQDGDATQFPDAPAEALRWTDEAKENWQTQFLADTSATWSGHHTFYCQKDWWESLQATTHIQFVAVDDNAHFTLNIKKIPPGEFDRSSVTSPAFNEEGEMTRAGSGAFDSEDLTTVNKPGGQQQAAVHEAGHMLGLDDEYETGETTDPRHSGMVHDEFGHSVARGADGRIMSGGTDVEPEHGVTFLEALKEATGMTEWASEAKPPTEVPPNPAIEGMGDFPTPDSDTQYA